MAKTKKVRFLVSRGSPTDGAIIRAGAVADLPEFWAERFIEDGTAEEVVPPEPEAPAEPEPKPKGKKKK